MPQAFKEKPPDGWKEAQPSDAALKGKWWEIYNDPQLNGLEEQVSISNQNVLAAEAQYRAARATVQIARAALFPLVTVGPTVSVAQGTGGVSANQVAAAGGVHTNYQIPFDVSYQVDLWGSIRRNIRANAETAQATEAQLENAKLTYQADLAQDYFQLRGTDGDVALLQSTVDSYTDFLKLTQARHDCRHRFGGRRGASANATRIRPRSNSSSWGWRGRSTSTPSPFSSANRRPSCRSSSALSRVSRRKYRSRCLPRLLERRPDIAMSERQMAALNEQIGIADAAFYPSLTLSASAGLASSSFTSLFTWAARFWTAGAAASRNFV